MTTAQAESTIPTGTWQSDPVHSTVGFAVRHAVGTFRGSFGKFDATLSDASGEPQLTGHVPGRERGGEGGEPRDPPPLPEFFDKEQTPEIRFESTRIVQRRRRAGRRWRADRQGSSKAVVARGEITGPIPGPDGNERIGIDLETKVDRHDYGLDWNMDMPDGAKMLGDEVTLTVHLELVKERRSHEGARDFRKPASRLPQHDASAGGGGAAAAVRGARDLRRAEGGRALRRGRRQGADPAAPAGCARRSSPPTPS